MPWATSIKLPPAVRKRFEDGVPAFFPCHFRAVCNNRSVIACKRNVMAGKDRDIYLQIWELLLRVQRKTRFTSLVIGLKPGRADASVSFAEGLTLLIVECEPDKNVKDLAELLKLERSWVSRIISQLEKRRLVQTNTPENDRRSRNVRITAKGKAELARLTDARAQVVVESFKELSDSEQKEMKECFRIWADGMHAPAYETTIRTHPLDAEMTRISWAVGVIGEDFMHSGMGVTKYHLLYELAQRGDEFTPSGELGTLLPVDLSTVSRTFAQFAEDGLTERKASSRDARMMLLRISDKGKKLWKEVSTRAAGMTEEALKGLSARELKRMQEVMMHATQNIPFKVRQVAAKETEIRSVDQSEAAELATTFFGPGRNNGTEKWLSLIDESKGKLFALFRSNHPHALIEMEKTADGSALKSFAVLSKDLEERECVQFIRNCLRTPHRRAVRK